jgi:hypothetical protein
MANIAHALAKFPCVLLNIIHELAIRTLLLRASFGIPAHSESIVRAPKTTYSLRPKERRAIGHAVFLSNRVVPREKQKVNQIMKTTKPLLVETGKWNGHPIRVNRAHRETLHRQHHKKERSHRLSHESNLAQHSVPNPVNTHTRPKTQGSICRSVAPPGRQQHSAHFYLPTYLPTTL